MPSYRKTRIEDEMVKTLSDIFRDVKDYRVANGMVTVTHVNIAPDLSEAKVFFSFIGGKYDSKEVRKGLISAHGFIRSQLAQRMNLRQTPRLNFEYDDSMLYGAKINSLMQKVEKELAAADERDRLLAEGANEAEDQTSEKKEN